MDATTKTWSLLNLILILITLGFAAMSTSSLFTLPVWLPWLFFGCAGVVVVWLATHLILSWSGEKKVKAHRRAIAGKLGELFLSGKAVKEEIAESGFDGDALAMVDGWADSVKEYFYNTPEELGSVRLLSLTPRQADWFVFGQFDPLGQGVKQDDRTYAFRHISIEMEKLLELIGEFLR
jgi:hypothetical protein